jgi:hypothetical protein
MSLVDGRVIRQRMDAKDARLAREAQRRQRAMFVERLRWRVENLGEVYDDDLDLLRECLRWLTRR